MKKTSMLATVSLFALGAFIGLSQSARADNDYHHPGTYNPPHHNDHRPTRAHFVGVFAYAANSGDVYWNWAITNGGAARATIDSTGQSAQGVLQINQNVGPNSALQNSAAVASIIGRAARFDLAVAYAINWGDVAGNVSLRGNCHDVCGGGTTNEATIRNSFGGARGVLNLNQNAGDNSLLQNATAIASFQYCDERCANVDLKAVAVATNYGAVRHNLAVASRSNANATIAGSFGNFQGVMNVNQNAGANSLLQNAAAVASIQPR